MRAIVLRDSQTLWQNKLPEVYGEEAFAPSQDPEQQLYDGFFGERDRRLCEQVRRVEPQELARAAWPFDDPRLTELLFRYRARNFADTLSSAESQQWLTFCQQRLRDSQYGAPNTLADFNSALSAALLNASVSEQAILLAWQAYGQQLQQRLHV